MHGRREGRDTSGLGPAGRSVLAVVVVPAAWPMKPTGGVAPFLCRTGPFGIVAKVDSRGRRWRGSAWDRVRIRMRADDRIEARHAGYSGSWLDAPWSEVLPEKDVADDRPHAAPGTDHAWVELETFSFDATLTRGPAKRPAQRRVS